MTHWQVLQGMCPYLDDGDNVVCTRSQRANWEGELIIGLFKDMLVIRRAKKLVLVGCHLVVSDGLYILAERSA